MPKASTCTSVSGRLEAATLFEKAIAIDPKFAIAYTKLAVAENNLRHFALRDKYAAQALKLADRLTPRERFYIEGYYYGTRPATIGRAIEAYTKCASLDAGHQGCRHNVALIYAGLSSTGNRHSLQYLVQRGATNATSFGNLALAYIALGEVDKARALVDAFSKRNPENAAGHVSIGVSRLAAGQFEEAIQSFDRENCWTPRKPMPW